MENTFHIAKKVTPKGNLKLSAILADGTKLNFLGASEELGAEVMAARPDFSKFTFYGRTGDYGKYILVTTPDEVVASNLTYIDEFE